MREMWSFHHFKYFSSFLSSSLPICLSVFILSLLSSSFNTDFLVGMSNIIAVCPVKLRAIKIPRLLFGYTRCSGGSLGMTRKAKSTCHFVSLGSTVMALTLILGLGGQQGLSCSLTLALTMSFYHPQTHILEAPALRSGSSFSRETINTQRMSPGGGSEVSFVV